MSDLINSAFMNRVKIAYGTVYVWVAIASAFVAAMTGLKSWSDLTGIQWLVLILAVTANAGNTILAFLKQEGRNLAQGRDMFSEGDTAILNKSTVTEVSNTTVTKQ